MGVNIGVSKILSVGEAETWSGKMVPYYEQESQNWFDSLRHSGDREFITSGLFADYDEDGEFCRPRDFEVCRQWVRKNIFEGSQARLIEAIDRMEQDESLVFWYSF
jgi:hypothetical protein